MAQVCLGGGLFVLEAALAGMAFRYDSPSQMAVALAIGMVGALPTACRFASALFGHEAPSVLELPVGERSA